MQIACLHRSSSSLPWTPKPVGPEWTRVAGAGFQVPEGGNIRCYFG